MTTAARVVLEDCRGALADFASDLQGGAMASPLDSMRYTPASSRPHTRQGGHEDGPGPQTNNQQRMDVTPKGKTAPYFESIAGLPGRISEQTASGVRITW